MSEVSKEDIIGEVGALLKRIDLKDNDFQRVEVAGRKTPVKPAHDKVKNAIEEYWHEKHPFIKRYSFMGIDILGKEVAEGRIILAVEVDLGWWRAIESCVKLADVRAENKIWVYITNSPAAKQEFQRALTEIRKLIKIRNENKESFGNFTVFFKSPKDFQKVQIF